MDGVGDGKLGVQRVGNALDRIGIILSWIPPDSAAGFIRQAFEVVFSAVESAVASFFKILIVNPVISALAAVGG